MSANTANGRLAALSLAALGVVYGDIGTSPLYALKEVFGGAHHPVPITPDNVLGILSLIFWSLMIVVSLKYVSFIMRADNKGEGGIMALMALALRPAELGGVQRRLIVILGLFGAALFYGDGVITPAISVLSAVEGLEVATPAFTPYILPISLLILIGLFAVQRHGTATVGNLFGPIMVLWFLTLGVLGVISIVDNPQVLHALGPWHAFAFFEENPILGFFSLGASVLALTGAEALYADMGHFGHRPIQLAWFGLVLPALILNYFGQGALLLRDPETIANPFYLLAPGWMLYPMVVLATVATVIASQAVISGAFSMTQQAMQLGFSPRMEISHTSDQQIGQIYLPAINWTLLAAVVALVIGFGNSSNLAAAYGIAVTGTMFITNLLAFVVARYLWGWSAWRAFFGALPFVVIDLAFFSANSVKIADGGWFPLIFGLCVYVLLSTWRRGRDLLAARLAADVMDTRDFIEGIEGVLRIPGTAVFLTHNPDKVPHAMLHSLKHYKALHERIVLVAVNILDVPHTESSRRLDVVRLPGNFWQVRVFYGFMEQPNLPEALAGCEEFGLSLDAMDTSFFLGRETLIPSLTTGMWSWRAKIFVAMFRNGGSAASFFALPANRVVELGAQVVL
ncbi:MAG TPA: potassium transporter Kup [Accumulibacter sp.]|uniref:potassium transporter Kup n=1 Tax=Accumulibacter sp. TaxID=2053492 RepID=UPI0025F3FA49|nr:potassium transporter Kup [Accumulibacter sp.]MCM8597401.1 potassium transporter Kup [Accumulibacter sp.]MCM8662172.1 potassium transporter Kup [Accumulibacter sp.]HNC52735.1 potassium transporter Kup [Accumulibacter sp.]